MKKIAFLFLVYISSIIRTNANCAASYFTMIYSNKVYANSLFILEAYGESQDILYELTYKYPITIEGGGKVFEVKILDICVSQFNLSQAVVKPIQSLDTGVNYSLIIHYSSPKLEQSVKLNNSPKFFESENFKVSSLINYEKPTFLAKPELISKSIKYYGCGPEYFLKYKLKYSNISDVIIKTTVKNLKTNIESTYYILPTKDEIKIGHNMCSGAFVFEDDIKYQVQFQIMDFTGNLSEASKPIVFTKPRNESS